MEEFAPHDYGWRLEIGRVKRAADFTVYCIASPHLTYTDTAIAQIPMTSDPRLKGIYQGVLPVRAQLPVSHQMSTVHRSRLVARVDIGAIDSDARVGHAAQLSKEILSLHSDVKDIGNTKLPCALVSLVRSSTDKPSVHKAISDYANGMEDAESMGFASAELDIPRCVLKTRIMHYTMNIIPRACHMYVHKIKDSNGTVSIDCDPYVVDVRMSPTTVMYTEGSSTYTELGNLKESAVHLLQLSRKRKNRD